MADKYLNEADWQKFAKGRGLKDAALLKAFSSFDKARDPAAQLEALDEIEKQGDALRKFVKGDRDFGSYLDNIEKSMEKERKLAKSTLKEAEAKEADDEEDTPLLLTAKMVPLLRQVRKGAEMQVMVASNGKEVAVLMARRAISPTRRKMLSEFLGGGTPKVFLGHCIFEENAHTFVMRTQASGLAKKIKAALLKQTELRVKVRVRGESPDDIDDDGEPPEDEDAPDEPTARGKAGATAPETSQETSQETAPDPLQLDYERRLAELTPRMEAPGVDATKVAALAKFATDKAKKSEWKAALAALDALEKMLSAPATPAATEAPAAPRGDSPPVNAGAAFNARLKALLPEIQKAIAGPPPDADVKLQLGSMGVHAKKGDFGDANAALDEIERLLKARQDRAAAESASASTSASQPGIDPKEAQAAELFARLQGNFETIERASLSPALVEQFQPIRNAWMMAVEAIESSRFDRAALILGKLESGGGLARMLAAVMAQAGANAAADTPRAAAAAEGGAVAIGTLRLKWNAARASRQSAIDNMLRVADALFETDDYADDPRTDEAAARLRAMAADVPTLDDKLSDLLDDFAEAPDQAERDRLRRQITTSIDLYRKQIDGQPLLMALQNTPLGYTPIAETIFGALTALEASLA